MLIKYQPCEFPHSVNCVQRKFYEQMLCVVFGELRPGIRVERRRELTILDTVRSFTASSLSKIEFKSFHAKAIFLIGRTMSFRT